MLVAADGVGRALLLGAEIGVLSGMVASPVVADELVTGAAACGLDEPEQPARRHNAVPNTADRTIKGGPAERVGRIVGDFTRPYRVCRYEGPRLSSGSGERTVRLRSPRCGRGRR